MKLGRRDWSGREDLNLRPLAPQTSALPGCATPRNRARRLTELECRRKALYQGSGLNQLVFVSDADVISKVIIPLFLLEIDEKGVLRLETEPHRPDRTISVFGDD